MCLSLNAAVFSMDTKHTIEEFLADTKLYESAKEQLAGKAANELYLHELVNHPELEPRLSTFGEGSWVMLDQIQPTYNDLLDKQSRQLQSLLEQL